MAAQQLCAALLPLPPGSSARSPRPRPLQLRRPPLGQVPGAAAGWGAAPAPGGGEFAGAPPPERAAPAAADHLIEDHTSADMAEASSNSTHSSSAMPSTNGKPHLPSNMYAPFPADQLPPDGHTLTLKVLSALVGGCVGGSTGAGCSCRIAWNGIVCAATVECWQAAQHPPAPACTQLPAMPDCPPVPPSWRCAGAEVRPRGGAVPHAHPCVGVALHRLRRLGHAGASLHTAATSIRTHSRVGLPCGGCPVCCTVHPAPVLHFCLTCWPHSCAAVGPLAAAAAAPRAVRLPALQRPGVRRHGCCGCC